MKADKARKPKKPWGRSRFCTRMAKVIRYYRDHHRIDNTQYHWKSSKGTSWDHLETLSHMLACYASQHVTYGGVDTEWAFDALRLWEMTTHGQMKKRLRVWYQELLKEMGGKTAFELYDKELSKYMLGGSK